MLMLYRCIWAIQFFHRTFKLHVLIYVNTCFKLYTNLPAHLFVYFTNSLTIDRFNFQGWGIETRKKLCEEILATVSILKNTLKRRQPKEAEVQKNFQNQSPIFLYICQIKPVVPNSSSQICHMWYRTCLWLLSQKTHRCVYKVILPMKWGSMCQRKVSITSNIWTGWLYRLVFYINLL